MAAGTLQVKDANNATQTLSVNQDATNANALVGATSITDPATGNKAQIAAFHNADNQNPGGTAFGMLTGGVAQLLNILGNLDRQREAGVDGVSAVGISTGAASFAMGFKTSIAGAITLNASPQAVTPGAMSGTIGGVAWSIQVGCALVIDTGASQEVVLVTAVSSTTFTAIFAKNHGANVVVRGVVFNMERDAAGEADGATGIGTAVAAEYEYNGGAAGGANFDRARSIQAKGRTTTSISAGGGVGSTSFTVGAAGTLKAGMQVTALKSSTFPAAGSYEVLYVDFSYVEGSTTVPLATAVVNSVTYDTLAYDAFAAGGPGLNGFNATGVGIEEEALYDPVTGLFFLERSATQDNAASPNVVLESEALFSGFGGNGFERARSVLGKNLTAGFSAATPITVTAPGAAGATTLLFSADPSTALATASGLPAPLKAGMQLMLWNAGSPPTNAEIVTVGPTYVSGTTVPITATQIAHAAVTVAQWEAFGPAGPGLNGFLGTGMDVDEDSVYDPVSNLYYLERSATADAMAPQNVVVEAPGLWNGATMDRARSAPGLLGGMLISSDGAKATYRYAALAFAPVATPTDFIVIQGSGTKTLRIKRIKLSGVATAQGNLPVQLVRRSTAGTLGSAVLTAVTAAKHDVNDAAATATVSTVGTANYTTLGTAAGVEGAGRLGLPAASTGATGQDLIWDFSTRQDKALILRGVADFLGINGNGATLPAGTAVDYEIEIEEDNS